MSFFSDRSYIRITEQEFHNLPLDIIAQAIFSLMLVMMSTLQTVVEFKEIRAAQTKSWETMANFPSFYVFNHRGRLLFSDDDPSHSA